VEIHERNIRTKTHKRDGTSLDNGVHLMQDTSLGLSPNLDHFTLLAAMKSLL
jgi:hypothetical protein